MIDESALGSIGCDDQTDVVQQTRCSDFRPFWYALAGAKSKDAIARTATAAHIGIPVKAFDGAWKNSWERTSLGSLDYWPVSPSLSVVPDYGFTARAQ